MTSNQSSSEAKEWHVALFEVRYDGKHSLAEDSSHFIAHGTRAELDALEAEIRDRGNWVRWSPEALHAPTDVREHYGWLFASEQDAEAEVVEAPALPQEPLSSEGRSRRTIEDRLRSNRGHAERTEKRRDAGKLSNDQAEALLRYWSEERLGLERELAELDAAVTG